MNFERKFRVFLHSAPVLLRSFIVANRKPRTDPEKDTEYFSRGDERENPIDTLVGSRIRMRRITLGYSAELLGEALGVSVGQLMKWESGSSRVGAERLLEISEFLHESPAAFFEDFETDPMHATANRAWTEWEEAPNAVSFAENLQLFWAFSRIADAEARKKVVALAVALASERELPN
jgi:transcriptional regulator with XRE-family HTH domain